MILRFLFICSFLVPVVSAACSCRGSSESYDDYRHNRAFVGKAVAISDHGTYQAYTFVVLQSMNSGLSGTVTISNETNAAGCQVGFYKDSIYLLQPYPYKQHYNIARCNFIRRQSDPLFTSDTTLLRQFSHSTIYIRSAYFEGQLKNGRRSGHWKFYFRGDTSVYEQGNYRRDKRHGLWKIDGGETLYRRDKIISWWTVLDESGKIGYRRKGISGLNYGNGKPYKLLDKHYYTVYYPDGRIKERTSVKKGRYFSGPRILYNPDGSILESKNAEEEYGEGFDASELVYDPN